MAEAFDAVVIGTGQSGPSLAVRMAKAGWKVAIVERGSFGGTCVNTGCIPTKALVASARAAWVARHAADWGVDVGAVSVDMRRVKARKDAIAGSSRDGVEKWLRETDGLSVIQAHARFEARDRVRVGDAVLEAPRIVINTGARPVIPDWPGLSDVPYRTSSTMMDVDFLPEHLVVAGGGYIGLEFAQMYRRFGSRVTVLQRGPRLAESHDDDVSAGILELLAAEAIDVHLGAAISSVERRGGGIVVRGDGFPEVAGSHLLLAVGRRPNTDDLGLQAAGVETDARGFVRVDDGLATSVPGIWATGDVNGRGAFTHTSYNDYEILAANLFDGESRRVSDRIEAHAVYVDPPVAHCGLTERAVRASGRRALIGRLPMARVGRARERGETRGFIKILVDADTQRILGATLFGIEADEVVHVLLDAMYADAPYTVVQRAMHVHPTVSELLPTVLGKLEPL